VLIEGLAELWRKPFLDLPSSLSTMDKSILDQVDYRKARLSDINAMGPVVRTLSGDASDKSVRRRLKRMLIRPGYHVMVVEHENRIVALNILREGLFLGSDAPGLQSLSLVVDSDYRSQGIASFLMEKAVEKSSREGFCQLWGLTQHEHLHKYYESLGFTNTGARFVIHTPPAGRIPLGRRIIRKLGL
jgi:N-acetylglutamate synthase-like GNAT family acetyltransferase